MTLVLNPLNLDTHRSPDASSEPVPFDLRAMPRAIPNVPPPGPRAHGGEAHEHPSLKLAAPDLRGHAELRLLAESFEDAQKARIAIENRLRSGADAGPALEALESLRHAEAKLSLALRRRFRTVNPELTAWAKETVGVGEHLLARLIGTIGHPVIASPYHWEGEGSDRILVSDPPYLRSVSQLWSYCGHGDPTRKRRKGMGANEAMALGNPRAKMLVHLIAESCVKCVGSAQAPSIPKGGTPADTPICQELVTGDPTSVPGPLTPDASRAGAPEGDPNPTSHTATSTTFSVPANKVTKPRVVTLGSNENDDESEPSPIPTKSAVRRRSPYRDTYDLARIQYSTREDWSDGHRHNAALRLVGKMVLRDIWIAAQ